MLVYTLGKINFLYTVTIGENIKYTSLVYMIDIENRGIQPQFCDRIDADKTIVVRNTFLL